MEIEARLNALGLSLPAAPVLPPGVRLPFTFVRVRGNRAIISGHSALEPDGAIAGLHRSPADRAGDAGQPATRVG
jgi:hypothetical protein